jgi:hypothetical protein
MTDEIGVVLGAAARRVAVDGGGRAARVGRSVSNAIAIRWKPSTPWLNRCKAGWA